DEAMIGLWIAAGIDRPGLRLERGLGRLRHGGSRVRSCEGFRGPRTAYTSASAASVNPLTLQPDRSEMRKVGELGEKKPGIDVFPREATARRRRTCLADPKGAPHLDM